MQRRQQVKSEGNILVFPKILKRIFDLILLRAIGI